MKQEEFDFIVRANGYRGASIIAARQVAVDGVTLTGAAKQNGCTPTAVHRALARIKKAHQRAFGGQ